MENIEPAFMEKVAFNEIAQHEQPNSLSLFLIFVPTLLVVYLLPFLATIFSKNNAKKWTFYWLSLLAATYLLLPILNSLLNTFSVALLFLMLSSWLLYVSKNQRFHIVVQVCEIFVVWTEQWCDKWIQRVLEYLSNKS